jgi:hypothetical protein
VAHPNDAIPEDHTVPDLVEVTDDDDCEEEFEIIQEPIIQQPSADTAHVQGPTKHTKKVRAQFGRRRTHNEQIIVTPCGMIIARETFYGAEGVATVVVSTWLLPGRPFT